MTYKTPRVKTTRLSLPVGEAVDEPVDAAVGTLGYRTDTDAVRVKTSTGWEDVGGGGGTLTEIDAGDGIVVTDGTGPVVTVEVDPAVLADIDDKLYDYFGTYTHKSVPTSSDRLALNDNAASLVPAYTTVGEVLAAGGVQMFNVSTGIAPLHWWRADNTVQTGGLVDTIVDNGSSPKNFTQTSTARCPTAVDSNGNTYLDFDGTADYYTAGVAADWAFSSNGGPCTVAVVMSRSVLATASQYIVGTGGADSTLVGFDVWLTYTSATAQGPAAAWSKGTNAQFVVYGSELSVVANMQVWIFRIVGTGSLSSSLGGVTTQPASLTMRRNGVQLQFSPRNPNHTYVSSNPNNTLHMGRQAGGGAFWRGPVYEVIVDNKIWTDEQCIAYESYAANRYVISGFPAQQTLGVSNVLAGNGISVTGTASQITITSKRVESPLTGMSPSPDSWNLEARFWTSADFAVNGWSITERDTATVLTRAGEVDTSVNPSAGTYRSSLRGGQVIVQTRSGVIVQITKAVTGTNNFTYKMHVRSLDYGTGYYASGFVSDTLNPSTVGARFYSIGLEQTNVVENLRVGPSTNTTYFTGAAQPYYNDFVCCVRSTSANSQGSYYAMTDGPGISGSTGRNNNLTIAYAGVSLYSASNAGYFFLDCIRRGTGSFDVFC